MSLAELQWEKNIIALAVRATIGNNLFYTNEFKIIMITYHLVKHPLGELQLMQKQLMLALYPENNIKNN